MVRIHTINVKKIKSKKIAIIFLIFIIFSRYVITNNNKLNFTFDLKENREKIPQYIEKQNIDDEFYKKILEETIPYVDEYSNSGHTLDILINNIILFFTDIKLNNLNTVLEQIIPNMKYVSNNSIGYIQNIVEVEGTFKEYKNQDEIINQNDEEFYNIDDDINVFEDPFDINKLEYTQAQLQDINFLQNTLYTFENNLNLSYEDIPVLNLLNENMAISKKTNEPQILIFHTHSQENFIDSDPDNLEEGVIGLGMELARILHEEYGIGVLHHKGQYDVVDGKLMRNGSYERMEPAIRKILEENPSIEVAIDLHRDGIEGGKLLTQINGKPTAKIMFVNGICKIMQDGELKDIESLPNPFIKENLAFSLKMQLKANELYPGFARKLYIKPYRYSLHMLPKSLLVEVGANTNTFEEAKNAMEPLAKILAEVLNIK
ncbi:stage II sporulation protein P [Defluviitalea phaphyphila]|uniref:stage II sporulation protein P n=1 Tax=Defluviitalea phaphyphila TaxID=1473580 RepID=UPI00073075A8|nr:stage II sporulation protein P [Defluviitalea phaphyphila]